MGDPTIPGDRCVGERAGRSTSDSDAEGANLPPSFKEEPNAVGEVVAPNNSWPSLGTALFTCRSGLAPRREPE
jgi:hypothetical protein